MLAATFNTRSHELPWAISSYLSTSFARLWMFIQSLCIKRLFENTTDKSTR